MKNLLIYILVAFTLIGCTAKEDYVLFDKTNITSPDANKTVVKLRHTAYEYKIQPHDRVSITMYNHPELGTSTIQSQREDKRGVLVDSRGYIRLPLIKNIHIAGLSQTKAQKKIEYAFKKYLTDAEVYLDPSFSTPEEEKYIIKHLSQASAHIENYCKQAEGWYRCPKLKFIFDHNLEKINRMEDLFSQINKELNK